MSVEENRFFKQNEDQSITFIGLDEFQSFDSMILVLMFIRRVFVEKGDKLRDENNGLNNLLNRLKKQYTKLYKANKTLIDSDIVQVSHDNVTNGAFLSWISQLKFDIRDPDELNTNGSLESGNVLDWFKFAKDVKTGYDFTKIILDADPKLSYNSQMHINKHLSLKLKHSITDNAYVVVMVDV